MRRFLLLLLLVLIAQPAVAQFGGGGMGGGRRGGGGGMGGMGGRGGMERGGREQSMKFPSAKTLEKYNPAELVLNKHKKLKLADAQLGQLKDLRLRIFERNASLLAQYDSLQRDFRPPKLEPRGSGEATPAVDSTRRAAMLQLRQMRLLVDSLQDRRRADVRDVLLLLADDGQRKSAAELLDKQDIKFADEFPAPPVPRAPGSDGGQSGAGEGRRGGRRPPA